MNIPVRYWTYVNAATGGTTITLPKNWSECYIMAQYGNSSGYQLQVLPTVIVRDDNIIGKSLTFGGGTIFAQVYFDTINSCKLLYFGVSGTDFTSTSRILVYTK